MLCTGTVHSFQPYLVANRLKHSGQCRLRKVTSPLTRIKLLYNTLTIIQLYCKKVAGYLQCVLFEFPLHMSLTMTTSSPIHSLQFYIYSLLFVVGSLEAEDMTEAGLRTSTFELWSTQETIKFLLIIFKKCPTFGYTSLILRMETGRKSLKASQNLEDDCFT